MKKIDYSAPVFETMIKSELLYVDKTEYLRKLITQKKDTGIYFLSRPRRFGKSLTVSTLEAIFQGKKELFKGLEIYEKYDWNQTYPVIHLDLVNCDSSNASELKDYLSYLIEKNARIHRTKFRGSSPGTQFDALICDLSVNSPVVVLIEEYDMPILNNRDNPHLQEIISILKNFYATIKGCCKLLRFVFITGVSRFSQVSVFSGLNNLEDISMHPEFATMLGYTQNELENNFSEHIDAATSYIQTSRTELLGEIKEWYDGYRFCENAERVYNPFAIANFFKNPFYKFKAYWYSSATPTSLLNLVKAKGFDLKHDIAGSVSESNFEPRDISAISLQALLFQTGYLTIKETTGDKKILNYILDYPNLEVEKSFKLLLLSDYLRYSTDELDKLLDDMKEYLRNYNLNSFINHFNTILAGVSYEVQETRESTFQIVLHTTLFLLRFKPRAEVSTNRGRIDHVLELPQATYIIEHKLNQSAEAGLKQIKTKGYADAYLHQRKKIILFGINYSSETCQVKDWKAEILSDSGKLEREILPPRSNGKKNAPKKTPKNRVEG